MRYILSLSVLAISLAQALPCQAQIAGQYVGLFGFYGADNLQAELTIEGESRFKGTLAFWHFKEEVGPERVESRAEIAGRYDAKSGIVTLEFKKWIGPAPVKQESDWGMGPRRGSFDRGTGTLTGDGFELARRNSPAAAALEQKASLFVILHNGQRESDDKYAKNSGAYVRAEERIAARDRAAAGSTPARPAAPAAGSFPPVDAGTGRGETEFDVPLIGIRVGLPPGRDIRDRISASRPFRPELALRIIGVDEAGVAYKEGVRSGDLLENMVCGNVLLTASGLKDAVNICQYSSYLVLMVQRPVQSGQYNNRSVTLRIDELISKLRPARTDQSAGNATVPPRYEDRRLPAIKSAASEERCGLLMRWLGRFQEEQAIGDLDHGGLLLFRDEDFLPLFGQRYDETAPKWRKNAYDDFVAPCRKNTRLSPIDMGPRLKTFAEQVTYFDELLEGAFVKSTASVSPEVVINAVKKGRENRALMFAALDLAFRKPNMLVALDELKQQMKPMDQDPRMYFFRFRSHLWPSEQRFFIRAMHDRMSGMALAFARDWSTGFSQTANTVDAATKLHAQIQEYAPVLATIDAQEQARIVSLALARLGTMLKAIVSPYLTTLSQAPATLRAAVETSRAAVALEEVVQPFIEIRAADYLDAAASMIRARHVDARNAVINRARQDAAADRSRIQQGAFTQWQALVSGAPDLDSLKEPAGLLRQAFLPAERTGDLYKKYERVLALKAGLDTAGFTYPDIFTNFYFGRFDRMTTNSTLNGNQANRGVLEGYVVKFSEQCREHLVDPVEIVRIETEEWVRRSGFVIDRTELSREIVRTGIFADREFADAYTRVNPIEAFAVAVEILRALGSSGTFASFGKTITTGLEVRADVGRFLARHGCASPVTKRLADNILRLSQGREARQPILN